MADEGPGPGVARPAQLVSLELGDWLPIGGDVRLKLGGQRTVLVGRNGAGKSALLEGLWLAALRAKVAISDDGLTGLGAAALVPRRFLCELHDDIGALRYEYQCKAKLEERCWRPATDTSCWQLKDGVATLGNGTVIPMSVPAGVLSLASYLRAQPSAPMAEIDQLSDLFSTITRIPAGIPRQQGRQPELVVTIHHPEHGGARYETSDSERRIGRLAKALVIAHERDSHGVLAEFEELGRRLGAWQDVVVDIYDARRGTDPRRGGKSKLPETSSPPPPPQPGDTLRTFDPRTFDPRTGAAANSRQLATVSFDGVDIGLLADGTLRVAEILWALVGRTRAGRNLLLIEEPETGLYPGLLAGLLDTISLYSTDRQIIMSTHSPQVVSWAAPSELRLITRPAGKTRVRNLSEPHSEQITQLLKHLQGRTIGQFLYSGVLDDEE